MDSTPRSKTTTRKPARVRTDEEHSTQHYRGTTVEQLKEVLRVTPGVIRMPAATLTFRIGDDLTVIQDFWSPELWRH